MPFDSLTSKGVVLRNDVLLQQFALEYQRTKEPVEVNFRELVTEITGYERYTHLIHSYPAKLITQIPYLFINNSLLSNPGDTILDPFCGSGTTLLAAREAKRNYVGIDIVAEYVEMARSRLHSEN